MSDMNNPSDENSGALDDLWADALNEQKATPAKSAADAVFQQLGLCLPQHLFGQHAGACAEVIYSCHNEPLLFL